MKKDYEYAGFYIKKIEGGITYTKNGLISERFTKKQLEELFNKVKLQYKVLELNQYSILYELTR